MEITQRTAGEITVIDLAGEIDLYNSGELKSLLTELVDKKQYRIVLNLKRVSYMDSTAIGVLVHALNLLKTFRGELVLAETADSIEKVLRLTKLVTFFQLWPTEAEALAAIRGG